MNQAIKKQAGSEAGRDESPATAALHAGEALAALHSLFDRPNTPGEVVLTPIIPNGPTKRTFRASVHSPNVERQLSDYLKTAGVGANCYYRAGEVSLNSEGAEIADTNIVATYSIWGDFDAPAGETPEACTTRVGDMLEALEAARLGPDIVVNSGNGVQVHWLTARVPFTGDAAIPREVIRGFNKRIAAALGGDPAVVNVGRLLRLPGTTNLPTKSKRAKGRVPCRASLVSARPYDPARRRLDTLEDIEAFVGQIERWAADNIGLPAATRATDTAIVAGAGFDGEAWHIVLPEWMARWLLQGFKQAANRDLERNRWQAAIRTARHACSALPDDEVRDAILDFDARWEDGPSNPEAVDAVLSEQGLPDRFGLPQLVRLLSDRGWADNRGFLAKADFSTVPPANDNDMPGSTAERARPVLLQDVDVAGTLDGLEASIVDRGLPLYQRGTLVMVVRERYRDRCGREVSSSSLRVVTAANLTDFASRHFDVRRPGRKGEVPALLSHQHAAAFLDRGEWSLPTIGALVQAPALARSGRIVSAPGFDAESGIYLADTLPGFVVPDPAAWRTEADARRAARKALDLVAALFSHYSFKTPADRSVALAALLTPFAVHAGVRGPLFAFNGTGPGVGKSKLVDTIAVLLTGARAQAMTQGVSAAEFEKHMLGKVLEGALLLNIDNVEQPLEGDTLNAVLTQEKLSIRPLGTSRTVTVEHRLTLYATGNNLMVRGDMARRVLTCRIDPSVERPELRAFPFDPTERAAAERAALVSAVLTVLAAHAHCGFPGVAMLTTAYGSFEEWSRYVRAALVWLGEADPLDVTARLREADPVLTRLGAVLEALASTIGLDALFGAKDIVPGAAVADFDDAAVGDAPAPRQVLGAALQEALAEERIGRGVADAAGAGRYLTKHEGRVVNGLRLDRARNDAKRGHLYRVSRIADANPHSAGGGSGG